MMMTRNVLNAAVSRTSGPPIDKEQVGDGNDHQEDEQQRRHRGTESKVQVGEGVVVDVEGDQVAGWGSAFAEEDGRVVVVVERPEEQHEHQHAVDSAELWERDRAPLAERLSP